jgi:hypothetical protein
MPSKEFNGEFVERIRSDPPGRYGCLACLPRIALRSILGYFRRLPPGAGAGGHRLIFMLGCESKEHGF